MNSNNNTITLLQYNITKILILDSNNIIIFINKRFVATITLIRVIFVKYIKTLILSANILKYNNLYY